MQRFGGFIFVFGLFAIILGFFHFVPKLLVWIYLWGEGMAWAIKIGLVILGGALWLIGKAASTDDENTAS